MIPLRQRTTTALGAGVLVVLAVGLAVALLRPGGLGTVTGSGDGGDAMAPGSSTTDPTTTSTTTTSTTTSTTTASTTAASTATTDPGAPQPTVPADQEEAPRDGHGGSGLATEGAGSVGGDLADTGGPGWLVGAGGGLLLAAAGASALRRRAPCP